MSNIDITGLDKAALLAGLYNALRCEAKGFGWQFTTIDAAQDYISSSVKGSNYYYALQLHTLKVDIGGDTLDPTLYDRDNGQGAAALTKAADTIRALWNRWLRVA